MRWAARWRSPPTRRGIQFRILNSSKGPAVRATRAQADRILYKAAIRRRLENQPNLTLFQQAVDDLMVEGDRVVGAVTQVGIRFRARTVVLTAGTFLDGTHPRRAQQLRGRPGGRSAGGVAVGPAEGTEAAAGPAEDRHAAAPRRPHHRLLASARSSRATWTRCRCSASWAMPAMHPRQVPCWITHTNERTHDIIRSGFDRSPMFTGKIEGVGPRYCPSVEDKINRFADKESHQIFLEPEGLTTNEFYPNGISTSLPFDIQYAAGALDGRAGERPHPAAGLRHRVRLLRPARAQEQLRDPGDRRPVLRRPDQRHHRLRRGGGAGPVRRHQRRAAVPGPRGLAAAAATRPTWACWSTT